MNEERRCRAKRKGSSKARGKRVPRARKARIGREEGRENGSSAAD